MPIALDPKQSLDLSLDDGATFVFRYLTRREAREAAELFEAIDHIKDPEEAFERITAFLHRFLRDWRNVRDIDGQEVGYRQNGLDDVLHDTEIMELFVRLRIENQLGGRDLKNSASQSRIDSAESAEANPVATAPTPRASSNPPSPNAPCAEAEAVTTATALVISDSPAAQPST